jgi:hypothetical protein
VQPKEEERGRKKEDAKEKGEKGKYKERKRK